MPRYIDTNILYYKFSDKNYPIDIKGENIISITALEFLKNIEKVHNNRAKYYIPGNAMSHFGMYEGYLKSHNRNRPFPSQVSDSIIFDFKHDFQSYSFYNNETVTAAINEKAIPIFQLSISSLQKDLYKEVRAKFLFVIKNDLACHSIRREDIELSYTLLNKFLAKHSLKGDFRNSWNDLLILGKVANMGGTLISSDKLLNQFAASEFGAKILKNNEIFEYEFPSIGTDRSNDMTKFESKGYINRGWAYRMNKSKQLRKEY